MLDFPLFEFNVVADHWALMSRYNLSVFLHQARLAVPSSPESWETRRKKRLRRRTEPTKPSLIIIPNEPLINL